MSEYKELSCLAYDLRKKVVEMVVSVKADTVVDVRSFHDFCLQAFQVLYLNPYVGSLRIRSLDTFCISKQQGVLSVVSVKTRQCHFA